MSYMHGHPLHAAGCPGCPRCAGGLGDLGWDTQFLPFAWKKGHELLTERAIPRDPAAANRRIIRFTVAGQARSRELTPADVGRIIRGNQDADVAYLRKARALAVPALLTPLARPLLIRHLVQAAQANFGPNEQKHHSLRRTAGQSPADALREIIADLRAQHDAILAESNWNRALTRIGAAIHLIQDSFSPAHTERTQPYPGCISKVRHYALSSLFSRAPGGGVPRPEHGVPTDDRDRIDNHPRLAQAATEATRKYLAIVFKARYGRIRLFGATFNFPDAADAVREAAMEFNRFIQDHFRLC